VERLTRIEAILEEQSQRLDDIARGNSGTPGLFSPQATRLALDPFNVSHSPQNAAVSPSASSSSQENLDTQLEQAQFLIPYDHSTSANSLLSWPAVKPLIGDYPKDYFFRIEESLPLPRSLDILQEHALPDHLPTLSPNELESLVQNYFSAAHPNFPLFTYQTFQEWQAYLYEHGPENTPETAICLCVYALGCLVSEVDEHIDAQVQAKKDQLALQFFQPALRIIIRLTVWSFRSRLEICQALLLAASCFAHLGRPLHSWKMGIYASSKYIYLQQKSVADTML
jgi:hypothetical protein